MMKYAVVFESPTGNTEMLAEEIRKSLGGESCVFYGGPDEALPEADLIFVGFWTDKGDCSDKTAAFLEKADGKNIFLFGTAGFGGDPEYFRRIEERVLSHLAADAVCVGAYMCQGKMPGSVRKRYEAMLEKNPEDGRMKGMIENFDRALSHPDRNDLDQLIRKIKSLDSEK